MRQSGIATNDMETYSESGGEDPKKRLTRLSARLSLVILTRAKSCIG